jgi:hypothetical protein
MYYVSLLQHGLLCNTYYRTRIHQTPVVERFENDRFLNNPVSELFTTVIHDKLHALATNTYSRITV